jgi:hypothetical protein
VEVGSVPEQEDQEEEEADSTTLDSALRKVSVNTILELVLVSVSIGMVGPMALLPNYYYRQSRAGEQVVL